MCEGAGERARGLSTHTPMSGIVSGIIRRGLNTRVPLQWHAAGFSHRSVGFQCSHSFVCERVVGVVGPPVSARLGHGSIRLPSSNPPKKLIFVWVMSMVVLWFWDSVRAVLVPLLWPDSSFYIIWLCATERMEWCGIWGDVRALLVPLLRPDSLFCIFWLCATEQEEE